MNPKQGKEIRGEIKKTMSQDGQVSGRKMWSLVSFAAKLNKD